MTKPSSRIFAFGIAETYLSKASSGSKIKVVPVSYVTRKLVSVFILIYLFIQ